MLQKTVEKRIEQIQKQENDSVESVKREKLFITFALFDLGIGLHINDISNAFFNGSPFLLQKN